MAEALFTAAGTGATSARNAPAEHVHPEVVEIMRKVGVDLHRVPSRLEDADAEWADLVVTMCCGDSCPYIPGKRYIDSELTDPHGQTVDQVRRIRGEIASAHARSPPSSIRDETRHRVANNERLDRRATRASRRQAPGLL
jgi:arsenate reductase